MAARRPASALLSKYLEQYRKQPGSRVFAPLAESYRKLGMYDEALKILREGIKRHPGYVLGYLVLAQCYHDQQKNEAAYQTLLPLTGQNRDNPGLQKLFAQVCLDLGQLDEALETFKYLLFLNPSDKYFAQQVRALEDDLQKKNLKPQAIVKKAPAQSNPEFSIDEDDWSVVDFSPEKSNKTEISEEDNWSMSTGTQNHTTPIGKEDDWKIMSRSIDDDFFSDEEVTPEDAEAPIHSDSAPLASHTLVDLYMSQNHIGPAIDLLEKIIELNPQDTRSIKRLKEIKKSPSINSEADGHDELMRIIENEVQAPEAQKMERALRLFLQNIQLTADEKKNNHA
ncbi:MAG: tetratricopeptide repeat protein [Bacteriovoracaceae bacterium]|nr:tetratricopeptide repeat protein [Bacteriovoracaceae bacterium]